MAIGFPGLKSSNRQTVRGPINPLDKTTLVSIYPRDIVEFKPTIQPGRFEIRAGSYDKPSILAVGPSSWWRDIDEDQPLLEIPVSSIMIADSIIKDYANGLVACDMGENMPGLFFLPGDISVSDIKVKFKDKLETAKRKQDNWYKSLVRLADALWARSNGNPLSIPDTARLAAHELNMKDKPWMGDIAHAELSNCPACGSMINTRFPVCSNCKNVINKELAKQLGLEFAK